MSFFFFFNDNSIVRRGGFKTLVVCLDGVDLGLWIWI